MQKDAYQVLRQRELEIERVRREIESLRTVIPLLDHADEEPVAREDSFSSPPEDGNNGTEQVERRSAPKFWTFGRKKEAKA